MKRILALSAVVALGLLGLMATPTPPTHKIDWCHFPPVWLRESKRCTLMKCLEHNQDTNYLSIFDPKTLARISSLDLRARLIVEGLMTGMHRSPYQGISVEFA